MQQRPSPVWMAQRERGQQVGIRIFVSVALALGRRASRLLLLPIAGYFLVFSVHARAASRQYLRRALGREAGLGDLYRHFHTFAATLLDRIYLLDGQYSRFDVRMFNEAIVRDMLERGEGGFLLGAHMGSFEVVRTLGREVGKLQVRMVMYEETTRKLNDALEAINPAAADDLIGLGRIDSMLRVERALAAGEFVGMLADRTIQGTGTMPVPFLGATAHVPVGPFRIAAIMKRPVVLMLGLYRGGNRYDIHFEHLLDVSHWTRGPREAVIEQAVRKYVERLEHYCRVAPYNWFNFYDYWH